MHDVDVVATSMGAMIGEVDGESVHELMGP